MGSAEVLAGTRVLIAAIQRLDAAGWSAERIIDNYPGLTKRDVAATMKAKAAG